MPAVPGLLLPQFHGRLARIALASGDLHYRRDDRALDPLLVERGAGALRFLRREVEEPCAVEVVLAGLRWLHDLQRLAPGNRKIGGGPRGLLGGGLDAECAELDAPALGSRFGVQLVRNRRSLRLGDRREVGGEFSRGSGELPQLLSWASRCKLVGFGNDLRSWCCRLLAARHNGRA